MSILADVAKTAVEATPASQPAVPFSQPNVAIWVGIFICGWTIIGLILARAMGVFRRYSIVGPPRIDDRESAWSLLFTLLLGTCIATVITGIVGHFYPGASELKLLAQSALLEGLGFVFVIAITASYRPAGTRPLGLRPALIPPATLLGAGAMFILFPLILLFAQITDILLRATGLPTPAPHEVLQALGVNHEKKFVLTAIVLVVIVAPLFEELVFRGFLQVMLTRFLHWITRKTDVIDPSIAKEAKIRWTAVIITAAVFAAVHHELGFFPPLFVLALGLGYLYERTGNLWATIMAHALFNGVQLMLFFGTT